MSFSPFLITQEFCLLLLGFTHINILIVLIFLTFIVNFAITVALITLLHSSNEDQIFLKNIAIAKCSFSIILSCFGYLFPTHNILFLLAGVFTCFGDFYYVIRVFKLHSILNSQLFFQSNLPENKVFNSLWETKKEYLLVNNRNLRIVEFERFNYQSTLSNFSSKITVVEGHIIIEQVVGKVLLEDAIQMLINLESVLTLVGLEDKEFWYITDLSKIESVPTSVRKYILEFHKRYKSKIHYFLVTNDLTRVLLKLMLPLSPNIVSRWTVVKNVEETIKDIFVQKIKPQQLSPIKSALLYQERFNQMYELISKLTFRQYNTIKTYDIPKEDPFYDVFVALNILNEDNKNTLDDLNKLLSKNRQSLKEQDLHFQAFFENSSFLTAVVNQNDVLVDFNDNFDLFIKQYRNIGLNKGYHVNNFLGKKYLDFYYTLKTTAVYNSFQEEEVCLARVGFDDLWLSIRYYKVEISNLKVYTVFLLNDITIKKKMEIEKEKVDILNKEHNEKIKEFSFLLSHKMRHNYAKLQSVVDNIDDPSTIFLERSQFLLVLDEMSSLLKELDGVLYQSSESILSINTTDQLFKNEELIIRKVVLIDDDDLINKLHKMLWNKISKQVEVISFNDPTKALEYLEDQNNRPDLILLDINMPEMNGWQVLDILKEQGSSSLVMILSSSHNPEDVEKATFYSDLVVDYLVKPVKKDYFIEKLAEHNFQIPTAE